MRRILLRAGREGQLDLALAARDPLHADRDRVAEPIAAAGRPAGERRPELVQLEELAVQPARRQEALEDLAEACEETGADQPHDLSLPRLLPAQLEEPALE